MQRFITFNIMNRSGGIAVKRSLIAGGTGMLAHMSTWVMKETEMTMVIGRNNKKLERLIPAGYRKAVRTEQMDYHDTERLQQAIQNFIHCYGAIDCVIAWVHGNAPKTIPAILNQLNNSQKESWRFFHIKGSSTNIDIIQKKIDVPKKCLYREVQLGFKMEGNFSRWLTHDEISSGVIDAIKNDRKKTIVGVLEPWEKRP